MNIEQTIQFKRGTELFRKRHNLEVKYPEVRKQIDDEGLELKPDSPVKACWYKKVATKVEWNEKYKHTSCSILNMVMDKRVLKEVEFAFLAIIPPLNCLEITNEEELLKIQRHREATNSYPQPFKKI